MKFRRAQGYRELPGVLALLLILVAAYAVYLPGLSGGFLFDDFPNLAPLAHYGGVVDWDSFRSFVFGGFSGPTGRPIALASFLLNDNSWPSDATGFKLTNLLIHLLAGLVLCWATLLLMRLWGIGERGAVWMALINMGLWVLHPYMVSTTLYVVQRMAQLAALFMFAGIVGYLHGRLILRQRPLAGYLWMSGSVGIATLLAVLSKENGVLLPLLIITIEFCLPVVSRANHPLPDWRWSALFLWVPAAMILIYLGRRINFSPELWPTRPFNQVERLMSEGRILWEYLYHLWIPRIEGRGLFQDGYPVSRSWRSPPVTLLASIALGVLTAAALLLRRRWPLFSLAVLFFLAAHLIESSVIGLELYFEHRNYAAAAFLFLPLASGLCRLEGLVRPAVLVLICGILMALLGGLTWQRATLWSDSDQLQNYWAVATPNSPRAQNRLAIHLFRQGHIAEGMAFLEDAGRRLPESSLLTSQWLLQRVLYGVATEADFRNATERLAQQRFDAQAVLGLRMITENLIRENGYSDYRRWMLDLVEAMRGYPHYNRVPLFRRLSSYFQGLLLLAEEDVDGAMIKLSEAMQRYADTDTALSIVAHVGAAGYPEEGLVLLEQARQVFSRQSAAAMRRAPDIYSAEMDRLENVLKGDIRALQARQVGPAPAATIESTLE